MTKILLKKSSALDDKGTGPKLPTSGQLDHGEIAINFLSGHETISLKNSDDKIVPIKINGDGKILTETDVVDLEPDTLTDDYKVKPVSAYRSFTGLNALANRIYGEKGLNSQVVTNSGAIATNSTNIAANTKSISGLSTGLDKVSKEVFGEGTTEKPGLITKVTTNTNKIATNTQTIKNLNNELDTIKNQLKGIETQTTSIISKEDDIITNAQ